MSIDYVFIDKNSLNNNTCYKFHLPSIITGLIFNLLPPSPILPKKGGIREKGEKNFLKEIWLRIYVGNKKDVFYIFNLLFLHMPLHQRFP